MPKKQHELDDADKELLEWVEHSKEDAAPYIGWTYLLPNRTNWVAVVGKKLTRCGRLHEAGFLEIKLTRWGVYVRAVDPLARLVKDALKQKES